MVKRSARAAARRPASLGTYLVGLVVLSVLPLLAAATGAMTAIAEGNDRAFLGSRENAARALALAIDSEIERLKPALRSLARPPPGNGPLEDAELRAVHERITRFAEETGNLVWVQGQDEERPWLLVSGRPIGDVPEGGLTVDLAALRQRAEASGQPELDGLVELSPVAHRPIARLVMPIRRAGETVGAMGMLLDPGVFRRILDSQRFEAGEFAVLLDGGARIVAGSSALDASQGARFTERLHAAIGPAASGTVVGPALDGTRLLVSFARLPHSADWLVGVATPEHMFQANRERPWLVFGTGAGASLGIALLGAFAMARQLVRPLARIAARAEAVAAGQALPEDRPRGGPQVDEYLRLEGAVQKSQERLIAEARAAQQREALLQSVTDSSADAIFVKDLEGRYRLANRVAAARLGYPVEAVIGRTDSELHPELGAIFGASDRAVLAEGRPDIFEVRLKHGSAIGPRVLQVAKGPWRDPVSGEVLGVVGVSRDVTEHLDSEARLRETERNLHTLARRATINAMASGMAHELSQPLTAASNYLHVAALAAEREGLSCVATLQLGKEQVRRAGEILRQMRQFLRREDTDRQPSSIPELVEDAMHLALSGLDVAPPPVSFRADPGLALQLANPVQVQQVVVNLVRNACEALAELPEGRSRLLSVAVQAAEEGGVAVTVADDGPGMPPEIVASLFEPFRSTKPAGSGIGLAICRAIVESHGGRINVVTEQGRGTIVRFTLADTVDTDILGAS